MTGSGLNRWLGCVAIVTVGVVVGGRAAADPVWFGINGHVPTEPELARAEELGHVRIEFLWRDIEPEPDQFSIGPWEDALTNARNHGLKVLALVAKTPPYVCTEDGLTVPRDSYPFPNHVDRWQAFLTRLVSWSNQRFPGVIAAWELWNEPHLVRFWEGTAWEYRERVQKPGYEAIKAADGNAVVLGLGGYGYDIDPFSGGPWDGGGNVDDVVRLLGWQYMDGISIHRYFRDCSAASCMPGYLQAVYYWMSRHNLSNRSVWLTETGRSTYDVTLGTQAAELRDFMQNALLSNQNVLLGGSSFRLDRVSFYTLSDHAYGGGVPSDPRERYFGLLLDRDHPAATCSVAPKPAAIAYERTINDFELGYRASLTPLFAEDPLIISLPATATTEVVEVPFPVRARNTGRQWWRHFADPAKPTVSVRARRVTRCEVIAHEPVDCFVVAEDPPVTGNAVVTAEVAPHDQGAVDLTPTLTAGTDLSEALLVPGRYLVELQMARMGRWSANDLDACSDYGGVPPLCWFDHALESSVFVGFRPAVPVVVRQRASQPSPSPIPYLSNAIFASSGAELSGNALVDGYDFVAGPYSEDRSESGANVRSNGSITLAENARVRGSAVLGPAGSLSVLDGAVLEEGTVQADLELPADPFALRTLVVDVLPLQNDNAQIGLTAEGRDPFQPAGSLDLSVQTGDSLTLPHGVYYLTSLQLHGDAKLELTGPATIAVGGPVTISGRTAVHPSEDPVALFLMAYSDDPDDEVVVAGQGRFGGIVLAPYQRVGVTGNGELMGAIWADTVAVTGNGAVHLDRSLQAVGP
ncbi:MAG: hypothetical protein HYV63_23060 [Candidatus Schekmanbacteria bacterium]|nr:hypothetical protein [Candidatus Schekmanbacteria bacterium]